MKHTSGYLLLFLLLMAFNTSYADNQTADNSPIFPENALPFRINIEQIALQLPQGNQSGAVGEYKGFLLIIGGRQNGLHGFINTGSFPISGQNTNVYVIDPMNNVIYVRDLRDSTSGLTNTQIESLAVTNPEFYQESDTLYIVGGYGGNSGTGSLDTKSTLSAIKLSGVVEWVVNNQGSFVQNMAQISNPIFQITGGRLLKIGPIMNLVFGQNFTGEYSDNSSGEYNEQIRRFALTNNSEPFGVTFYPSVPGTPDPNFRRRDFNALPALFRNGATLEYGLVVFSGVFTETGGVWTVPVTLQGNGNPIMTNPTDPNAFKQGMNVYASAAISLYSKRTQDMYNILLGGTTYQYYSNGVLTADSEIPFTNQVVTIKMDKNGYFSEYLMNAQYPTISASGGIGYYLFGANAYFVPTNRSHYANHVINLDAIRTPTVIGYVIGGIASIVPNTNDSFTETIASPYIFKVTLYPS